MWGTVWVGISPKKTRSGAVSASTTWRMAEPKPIGWGRAESDEPHAHTSTKEEHDQPDDHHHRTQPGIGAAASQLAANGLQVVVSGTSA